MRKRIMLIFILVVLSLSSSNVLAVGNDKIILIDPGHGGIDGGAVSKSGTVEKDINLEISLKLRDRLVKEGYKVIMTREEDKGLYTEGGKIRKKKIEDLENRQKMKAESRCDMFISIHLNMFPDSQYYGFQVWYGEGEKSKKIARLLQSNYKEDIDIRNRRLEKAANDSYKILQENSEIPQVIVECGFLSNYEEEEKLKSHEYQEKISDTIVKSINSYFKTE